MDACVPEHYKQLPELSREVCGGTFNELCGSREPGWQGPPSKPDDVAPARPAAPEEPAPQQASSPPAIDPGAYLPPVPIAEVMTSSPPPPPSEPMVTEASVVEVTNVILVPETVYETIWVTETVPAKEKRHPHHARRS